jgi:hypothetical protein
VKNFKVLGDLSNRMQVYEAKVKFPLTKAELKLIIKLNNLFEPTSFIF